MAVPTVTVWRFPVQERDLGALHRGSPRAQWWHPYGGASGRRGGREGAPDLHCAAPVLRRQIHHAAGTHRAISLHAQTDKYFAGARGSARSLRAEYRHGRSDEAGASPCGSPEGAGAINRTRRGKRLLPSWSSHVRQLARLRPCGWRRRSPRPFRLSSEGPACWSKTQQVQG